MELIGRFKAEFEALDEQFVPCGGDEYVEVLHQAVERPKVRPTFPAGRYLVWSDIPNDRLLRWDEATGEVGVFRQPAGIPTATRSIVKDGCSPASRATAGSPGPNTMDRLQSWPIDTGVCD